jgi:hypothetical protein
MHHINPNALQTAPQLLLLLLLLQQLLLLLQQLLLVLHVLLPLLRCDRGRRRAAGLTTWADLPTPRPRTGLS